MCTVSFARVNNGVEITSNRDETILRSNALSPAIHLYKHTNLIFPKDPQGGGSWIGGSENGNLACLLNGAFVPHKHNPPYRLSRGIVLLDALVTNDVSTFVNNYNVHNIEPFTLIIYSNGELTVFRWDEKTRHIKTLDSNKTHLWASAPLYGPETVKKRKEWFRKWEKENDLSQTYNIRNFHYHAGDGDPENDVIMKRGPFLQTVSVTSMRLYKTRISILHDDLIGDNSGEEHLDIEK
ncbi:NRDE family protein [Marinigracilibium pacificum]|uniref:NRDE family protein n=1 Tax=Marinigracilibium pacificum TaxID=2729599 RepID=A0A848IU06_9BACT|nr:NRDE family protein [Marinigracilibium pacificum]NMM46785.1 NRDE family protein [Marinigracilibium pacificum]